MDDTLPQSVAGHGSPPILHLYTFVPSVIVGKYQDIEAALRLDRCRARGIEFNRRSTGGGTVIMGPRIVALGLGINVDWPGLKGTGVGGVFESMGEVFSRALDKIGIRSGFRAKNDLEVSGRKIAGLSAASETGKSLLFHTSFLVDFDVELMTDIMNTPLVKLSDKGYNCFSRRMTTVKEELGREVSVADVMRLIQDAFEEQFGIHLKEDGPDRWEEECIAPPHPGEIHETGMDLLAQTPQGQDGGGPPEDPGRAAGDLPLPCRGIHRKRGDHRGLLFHLGGHPEPGERPQVDVGPGRADPGEPHPGLAG